MANTVAVKGDAVNGYEWNCPHCSSAEVEFFDEIHLDYEVTCTECGHSFYITEINEPTSADEWREDRNEHVSGKLSESDS